MDVNLTYNVTTSEDSVVSWCSVTGNVWYGESEGDKRLVTGLTCLDDDGNSDLSDVVCTDYSISKDGFNSITLVGLPAPQQYWWNVKCQAITPTKITIWDVGDVNWTFIVDVEA